MRVQQHLLHPTCGEELLGLLAGGQGDGDGLRHGVGEEEQYRQWAERLAGIMATLRGSMEDHPFDSSDESLAQLMKEFVDGNAAAFREYSEKWKGSAIANVDGDGAVHRETEAGDVIG
eukprot:GGOE01054391.1.p3 GENE.GGOE01054391.1~~GGOE01054391.1.p3  ORF type:complete len:118 (-),score=10.71 GGOE01054391.1:390-743(-)